MRLYKGDLMLSLHLFTVPVRCQSANRALGLLIDKSKAFGDLQYEPYTKLYDAIVVPIISYGAVIWATQSYACINAVQHRAARYFLNVGRYTPNAAVNGDIGWAPMVTKCWKSVLTFWCRCVSMNFSRLNGTVFRWAI